MLSTYTNTLRDKFPEPKKMTQEQKEAEFARA